MFNGLRDFQSSAKLLERTFDAGIKLGKTSGIEAEWAGIQIFSPLHRRGFPTSRDSFLP